MKRVSAVQKIGIVLLLSGPGLNPWFCAPRSSGDDLARLTAYMTGTFSSHAQSLRDTGFSDIRLHMAPIWPQRHDGPWLYVEQAEAGNPEKPYRQRVYRLRRLEDGSIESAVFTLKKPLRFTGAHHNPELLAGLSPDSLDHREGCEVFLRRRPDGSFYGKTRDTSCASAHRGAAYATSEVTVTSQFLITWDRGFNASGEQVWGSERGGYYFARIQSP